MKKIAFVTTNKSKAEEINDALKEYGFCVEQIKADKREDKDADMETVAKCAAKELCEELKMPLIVEDTGLFFKAYDNFPGSQPKFVFKGIGYDGIFRLLDGKDRSAYFETVIAYCEPGKDPVCFDGKMHGQVSEEIFEPKSDYMPYDSIFVPEGKDKPICQIVIQEKGLFSQRGQATKKLGEYLKNK